MPKADDEMKRVDMKYTTADEEPSVIEGPPDFAEQIRADFGQSVDGTVLREWWLNTAMGEVDPMIAKMVEYGGGGRALDLEEIGRGLVQSGVRPAPDGDDSSWYQELGVYFYLLGKFARWTAAVAEGRRVSDDTLLDIGVYVRMAQRIRDVGGWPV